MRDYARRYAAAALLMLFVAFAAGRTLFVHTHVGPDGLVCHSHPFLPQDHHSHSVADFCSLAEACALSFDDDIVASVCPCAIPCVRIATIAVAEDSRLSGAAIAVLSLRAPPTGNIA